MLSALPRLVAFLAFAFALTAAKPANRPVMPRDLPLHEAGPDSFVAEFTTTKGSFTMHAVRAWSPNGVDRLYHLVKGRYFDGLTIYRVGETKSVAGGRVVQFGQSGDTAASHAWERAGVEDEPALHPHRPGAVGFARGGPNTRSVEIAIATNAIPALDTVSYLGVVGFPVIAEVRQGFDVLSRLEGRYGNAPIENDSLSIEGEPYLKRAFPMLDGIVRARVMREWRR
jgi:cyclophilin family peptidyl-prolyl cis-trans isomerase